MKNLKLFSIILLTTFLFTSCINDRGNNGLFGCECGEGDVVSQTMLINEFSKVKLRGSSKVFITQGNDFEVIVEGQQNIIDLIETDIQNDTWEIEFEECIRDYDELKFYITMPDIKRLEVSGSGDIFGDNVFDLNDIELKVSGSGKINIEFSNADKVETKIEGSGKILLEGVADELEARTLGSGDLKAFDVDVPKAYVKIEGSGNTEVYVEEDLEVKISGSGDVFYKGNPLIDVDITGSGDLVNAN